MSNKALVKFIFFGFIILLSLAFGCWQTVYVNQSISSVPKVQTLEKLVRPSVAIVNINKSQNSEKATQVKTQPLSLTQALELAGRIEGSLSPSMRLTVLLKYYDAQQADEQVRIARAAVTNAQANLRDTQAQERAGTVTRFDVLSAQVNLGSTQQILTHALGLQRIKRSQLALQLGMPYPTSASSADSVQLAGRWDKTLVDTIAMVSQHKSQQQLQRDQKSLQIEEAYSCLQVDLENVQTTNTTLDQARETSRLARLRYQAGVGTQTEVIEAQSKLIIFEARLVKSILDYNRDLAYLQQDVSSPEIASPHLQYESYMKEGSSCSYAKKT